MEVIYCTVCTIRTQSLQFDNRRQSL